MSSVQNLPAGDVLHVPGSSGQNAQGCCHHKGVPPAIPSMEIAYRLHGLTIKTFGG